MAKIKRLGKARINKKVKNLKKIQRLNRKFPSKNKGLTRSVEGVAKSNFVKNFPRWTGNQVNELDKRIMLQKRKEFENKTKNMSSIAPNASVEVDFDRNLINNGDEMQRIKQEEEKAKILQKMMEIEANRSNVINQALNKKEDGKENTGNSYLKALGRMGLNAGVGLAKWGLGIGANLATGVATQIAAKYIGDNYMPGLIKGASDFIAPASQAYFNWQNTASKPYGPQNVDGVKYFSKDPSYYRTTKNAYKTIFNK